MNNLKFRNILNDNTVYDGSNNDMFLISERLAHYIILKLTIVIIYSLTPIIAKEIETNISLRSTRKK